MRIAQVAPLHESVPPKHYGGTERIVSYLTEELVRQGHEVTLFASGDSETAAHLVPITPRALRMDETSIDTLAHHILMLQHVIDRADAFDIIHFHIDYLHYPLSRLCDWAHVTTLHGRLDIPDLGPLYRAFTDMPVISISNAQRRPLPMANWQRTVYHGLPEDLYAGREVPGDYLAFLGRISPEKRLDRAIEIARRAGLPLRIAAKIDRDDREYFELSIRPLLEIPGVEYIGEIKQADKETFLGGARALLFPIDWPEPFGLVTIEAFACGTPVIAYPYGAMPEVMKDGVSGRVVESIEEAVRAVAQVERIHRAGCRRYFEQRFTVSRMARDYLDAYRRLVSEETVER